MSMMTLVCNPQNKVCLFFCSSDFVIFGLKHLGTVFLGLKYLDTRYLVNAIPPTALPGSF